MPTATAQPEEVDVFSGSEWEIEPAPAATLGADPFSGPEWEEETLAAPGPVVSTPDKVRPTIDVLAERMDNPSYIPSFEEWDRHRQTPNHSDMSYGESGELLKGIVKDTGKKLGGMIWESGRLVVGAAAWSKVNPAGGPSFGRNSPSSASRGWRGSPVDLSTSLS